MCIQARVQMPRAEQGWFSRNWIWVIAVGALGFLGAGVIVFVVGIFIFVNGSLKSSPVYKEALLKAQAHPRVIRELGQALEAGWNVNGSLTIENSSGEANLEIPVQGARGKGMIYVEARKTAGQWKYSVLQVVIDGQTQPIDLLNPQENSSEF